MSQEGKYVVECDKDIDIASLQPNARVALRNDSYALHRVLPTKVDPLVSLMKVEKVPDATYDMVGGLDKQIQELKEVIELPIKHPELFESLGIAQPKVRRVLEAGRRGLEEALEPLGERLRFRIEDLGHLWVPRSCRRRASPRAICDFTVPSGKPRASAISEEV